MEEQEFTEEHAGLFMEGLESHFFEIFNIGLGVLSTVHSKYILPYIVC